jgi:hypothetical protein
MFATGPTVKAAYEGSLYQFAIDYTATGCSSRCSKATSADKPQRPAVPALLLQLATFPTARGWGD